METITTSDQRNALLERVRETRKKVEAQAIKLKKTNTRFVYLSIIASTLATLLAGLTAAMGPLAGQGPPAWKVTCGAVAGLTAFAGLFTGLHQRFAIPEKLSKCYSCAGRLNALELALTVTGRDHIEVAKEYEEVAANYQDFLL